MLVGVVGAADERTGGNVLIKDATILTVTKGTIPKGSILIEKGKIKAVGKNLSAPAGVTVIEANTAEALQPALQEARIA